MVGDCRLQTAVAMGDGHCQGIGGGVVTMVSCMCISRGLFLLFPGFSLGCLGRSLILAPWMGCLVACVVLRRQAAVGAEGRSYLHTGDTSEYGFWPDRLGRYCSGL